MMRIEPRPDMTKAMLISVPILSAIASLVIAALPIAFAGADILQAYREMFNGVFGSVFAISEMLTRATPLMFTGLAAALAFRARLWNIGAEGQLYLGALMAVTVGTGYLDLPPLMLTPVIILMAALAGAVGMAEPARVGRRLAGCGRLDVAHPPRDGRWPRAPPAARRAAWAERALG